MEEIWKTANVCQFQYEVSNLGSLRHKKNKKNLSQGLTHGYCYPTLSDNGYPKRFRLHRLIAECFIQNPDNKPYINHKNGIKHDNRVENLEWCTASENGLHSFRVLGNEVCNKKKIKQFDKDMNFIARYESVASAGNALNIGHQQISKNLHGGTKICHGFIFKFDND